MPIVSKKLHLPCHVCGVIVTRYPSTLKSVVCCSRGCADIAQRNGSELFCTLCDAPFYRRFGEQDLDHRVNQFCSRHCYMQWRAIGAKSYRKIGVRHAHRVVVEQFIGRQLTSVEVVHHVDLDRRNCDLSNLMLFPDSRTHMLCHWGKLTNVELRRFSLV